MMLFLGSRTGAVMTCSIILYITAFFAAFPTFLAELHIVPSPFLFFLKWPTQDNLLSEKRDFDQQRQNDGTVSKLEQRQIALNFGKALVKAGF